MWPSTSCSKTTAAAAALPPSPTAAYPAPTARAARPPPTSATSARCWARQAPAIPSRTAIATFMVQNPLTCCESAAKVFGCSSRRISNIATAQKAAVDLGLPLDEHRMVEHHKYAAAPNKTNPIVVRNVGKGDLVLGGPVGRLGTATTTPTLTLILTLTSLASTVEVNLILRGNYYYHYYYYYYYYSNYYYCHHYFSCNYYNYFIEIIAR